MLPLIRCSDGFARLRLQNNVRFGWTTKYPFVHFSNFEGLFVQTSITVKPTTTVKRRTKVKVYSFSQYSVQISILGYIKYHEIENTEKTDLYQFILFLWKGKVEKVLGQTVFSFFFSFVVLQLNQPLISDW